MDLKLKFYWLTGSKNDKIKPFGVLCKRRDYRLDKCAILKEAILLL